MKTTPGARIARRGFTLLELGVIAAVVAALAALQLAALLYYQELSEKTEVQLTILNLRAGLRYQLAERMMRGRTGELPALASANPVAWLERPPAGYAGERRGAEAESLPGGSWYYDTDARELRYRPRLRNFLASDSAWLRWRVARIMAPGSRDAVESVALVDVERTPWFEK